VHVDFQLKLADNATTRELAAQSYWFSFTLPPPRWIPPALVGLASHHQMGVQRRVHGG